MLPPEKGTRDHALANGWFSSGAQHITVAGSGVGQKSFLNSCVGWLAVRKGSLWPHVRVVRSKVSNAKLGIKNAAVWENPKPRERGEGFVCVRSFCVECRAFRRHKAM